jgi:antitoxin PrlF
MVSRLSSKGQVTIPKQIRETLDLRPNDYIAYEVQEGVAILRKIEPFDAQYHKGLSTTLSEWDSAADEEAFGAL